MAESANNLQRVLDSQASDEVVKRMTLKKEILSAKKLFEATAQVPSPSKDFTQIVITERGMVWRKWKISLRGVSQGAVPQPSEEVMLHEDFQYDSTLQVCMQCLQTSLGQLRIVVLFMSSQYNHSDISTCLGTVSTCTQYIH
jgi:hypothetical protein